MSFLPIVDRELRQAGRRNRTYLSRTLAALGAIAVACVVYAANLFSPPQQMGQYIFAALSGLCLGHGLIAGRRLTAEWRRVGKRSDWVLIRGWGTIIGLTSDGTVWSWGLDATRKSTPTFAARLKLVQDGISSWFGRRAPGSAASTWLPPSREEPRPVMRLVPAESVGASDSIESR